MWEGGRVWLSVFGLQVVIVNIQMLYCFQEVFGLEGKGLSVEELKNYSVYLRVGLREEQRMKGLVIFFCGENFIVFELGVSSW